MTYKNSKNEIFYDTYLLTKILGVNLSYLKREMKKYQFPRSSYIKYNNKHLYTEAAIIDFINSLVVSSLEKDIRELSKKIKPTNEI